MKTLPLLLLPLLVACASSSTPNYDLRFGEAVRDARQRQTLNPAGSAAAPAGLDGGAAHESMKRYHDTFKTPPPVVNVINIGGSAGGGSR